MRSDQAYQSLLHRATAGIEDSDPSGTTKTRDTDTMCHHDLTRSVAAKIRGRDAVFGEHPITGSYFTCLFNGCLAGGRAAVCGSVLSTTREPARRKIPAVHSSAVESFAETACSPCSLRFFQLARRLNFKCFRPALHVIVAAAIVFDRQIALSSFQLAAM